MKGSLFLILSIYVNVCLSQVFPPGDSLTISTYDTSRIYLENTTRRFVLESSNQFPFCSKVYKVPKECNSANKDYCCKFSTDVYEVQKTISLGSLDCFNAIKNGYNLTWFYSNNIADAKSFTESECRHIEQDSLSYKKRVIKCYIMGKEAIGYLYERTLKENLILNSFYVYASYNQYNFSLTYSTIGKWDDSIDTPIAIREILRFR